MRRFIALIALIMFSATSAIAEWDLFPAFYDVTGVASDDVLNVRAGIGASHPIIEVLAYNDRYIEIVELSENGKWGLIGYPGGSGWASMRFLKRQPEQGGANLPRPLSCGGNEPFWGIEFSQHANEFNEPGDASHRLNTVWEGIPDGMLPVIYGIRMVKGADKMDAVITRSKCSDGMSENEYGFEINALLSGSFGNRMLTGCCSLKRPQN